MISRSTKDDGQPVPKEQKIRDSCNACSSQKIRCGKQRPKCSRCSLKGLDCEYSYSKRTGQRQPRERNAVDKTAIPGLPTSQPPTPPASDVQTIFTMADDTMVSMPRFMPPSSTYDDFSWMWNQTPQITPQDENTLFHPTPQAELNTAMDPFDFPMGNDSAGSAPQSIPSRGSGLSSMSESDQASEFGQGFSEASRRSHSFAAPRSSRSTSRGGKRRPHDCARAVLKVVADLHVSNQSCQRASEDSNARQHAPQMRDVDTVVGHNREALARLSRILDCPCSSEQDVLIVVYLAIFKVLSWYAAVLGSDNMSKNHRPLPALLDRVQTKPIVMGNYVLDVSASRVVRAHVVLTQVKENVNPLVKRLAVIQESHTIDSFGSKTVSPRAETSTPPFLEMDLLSSNHRALQDQLSTLLSTAENIKQSC